jgi:hypothetical protein
MESRDGDRLGDVFRASPARQFSARDEMKKARRRCGDALFTTLSGVAPQTLICPARIALNLRLVSMRAATVIFLVPPLAVGTVTV